MNVIFLMKNLVLDALCF